LAEAMAAAHQQKLVSAEVSCLLSCHYPLGAAVAVG
jgi:hypothetical protein